MADTENALNLDEPVANGPTAALQEAVSTSSAGQEEPPREVVSDQPIKAAPAKKKASTKKTAAKKKPAKTAARAKAQSAQQAKFPRHSVEKALRIPKAIIDQNAGKPTSVPHAAKYTTGGSANGPFKVEVSSAKKYGLLKSDGGKLVPEDRARQILYPQTETDRLTGLRAAVLDAPDLAEVYSHYRGENLPDDVFFTNALRDTFKIPADKIAEFLDVFYESMESSELIDRSGDRPRLIDVGRESTVPGSDVVVPSPKKVSVADGTTCFVMQPFGGHLGTYYESIFKPAIEQAGLTAVRADDDIFATGKIMDQVWRGIRQATVLVAELTSKNPNVFYELGLAHALEKPVILVSSNQEDVPFDLRHIRAIFYDQHDPFWGKKLIDKIADNITSALTNPEEAIFRADID